MPVHKTESPFQSGWGISLLSSFGVAILITLVLVLYAYFEVVSSKIGHLHHPSSYKWLLLEEVDGPRLIIESGSNSHHGLDAELISNALDITAINISDNAGYDIEQKVARLAMHANAGDIVVLPLEWSYYSRDHLTDDFVDSLPEENQSYFTSVAGIDRIRLALSLPPANVFGFKRSAPPQREALSKIQQMYIAALMQPFGHSAYDAPRPLAAGVEGQTCDEYLFGASSLKVSKKFRRALGALKRLRKSGVEIVFAWPVVVGDDCYSDRARLMQFAEAVEATVNDAGFKFLGSLQQSVYPSHLRDDTPYHLISAGAEIHTRHFIRILESHGIRPAGKKRDVSKQLTMRLYEMELLPPPKEDLNPFPTNEYVDTSTSQSLDFIDFRAGWWGLESFGRWMRSNEAVFSIRLPADIGKGSVLSLEGAFLEGGAYRTQVFSEGVKVVDGTLGDSQNLLIPMPQTKQDSVVEFVLRFPDRPEAQSPFAQGASADYRTLSFHLHRLVLDEQENVYVRTEGASQELAVHGLSTSEFVVEDANIPTLSKSSPLKNSSTCGQSTLCVASPRNNEESAVSPSTVSGLSVPTKRAIKQDEVISFGAASSVEVLDIGRGWWGRETAGRWMKCCESALRFALPPSIPENAILQISGDVFGGKETEILITINGRTKLKTQFSSVKPIVIPLSNIDTSIPTELVFSFPEYSFQSPKELGLSLDPRVLSVFVKNMRLTSA
ncbi:MAG: hypothetical protein R3B94_04710 [Hyphomonas sp.]